MKTQGLAGIPFYPELRNCPAPSAPRILDIFNDVKRHHLNTGVDLLNIPASIYT